MVQNNRFLLPILAFTLSSCGLGSQEISFQQVYSGFDGTVPAGVYYFDTREQIAVSWLRSAMPSQQYDALAARLFDAIDNVVDRDEQPVRLAVYRDGDLLSSAVQRQPNEWIWLDEPRYAA